MRILVHFALIFLPICLSAGATPPPLKPFTSNGCTGFADGTRENPKQWRHCCVLHDLAFWAGGCSLFRDQADAELKACVADTGAKLAALVMYLGVRLGAHSPFKIKNERWGNGWSDGREDHHPLSSSDFPILSEVLLLNLPADLLSAEALQFLSKIEKQIQHSASCAETQ